jgi:hypothetical protein
MILEQNPYLDALVQHRPAATWPSVVVTASLVALGACFAIVATLAYLQLSDRTPADELAVFAAAFFAGALALSVMTAARGPEGRLWSGVTFGIGLAVLALAVTTFVIDFT